VAEDVWSSMIVSDNTKRSNIHIPGLSDDATKVTITDIILRFLVCPKIFAVLCPCTSGIYVHWATLFLPFSSLLFSSLPSPVFVFAFLVLLLTQTCLGLKVLVVVVSLCFGFRGFISSLPQFAWD
jgi:hypothetical protein